MNFKKWMNSKVKKLDWIDISLTKLSVVAFTLFLTKLWKPLLSLNWYYYAIIFVLVAIRPMYRVYFKK